MNTDWIDESLVGLGMLMVIGIVFVVALEHCL